MRTAGLAAMAGGCVLLLGTPGRAEQAPLVCGLKMGPTIECTVQVDDLVLTNAVINRGRCESLILSPEEDDRVRALLSKGTDRQRAVFEYWRAEQQGRLTQAQAGLQEAARAMMSHALIKFGDAVPGGTAGAIVDALGPSNARREDIPIIDKWLRDPSGEYKFGDTVRMTPTFNPAGCQKVLEWALTTAGGTTWTWRANP